jgi:hypothetical protein
MTPRELRCEDAIEVLLLAEASLGLAVKAERLSEAAPEPPALRSAEYDLA